MDPLRTAVAAKGVELSALFFVVFEHFELGSSPPRLPRLIAPHGPSTGGGKMSRQHIALTPEGGASGPSVVVGWADQSQYRVELRTYDMVAASYLRRFGHDLEIPRGAYRRFMKQAESFFIEQGFSIVEVAETSKSKGNAKRSSSFGLWLLVLFATLLLGICLGILLMYINRGVIVVPSP